MYHYDKCFNYIFSRAQQTVLQIFRGELSELDITPVQYGVLSYLIEDNGASASQLAEHFGLEASTITGILDRLEKKGLVERQSNNNDRRAYKIVITQAGWDLSKPMLEVATRANRIVEGALGKEDALYIKKVLTRLIDQQSSGKKSLSAVSATNLSALDDNK